MRNVRNSLIIKFSINFSSSTPRQRRPNKQTIRRPRLENYSGMRIPHIALGFEDFSTIADTRRASSSIRYRLTQSSIGHAKSQQNDIEPVRDRVFAFEGVRGADTAATKQFRTVLPT